MVLNALRLPEVSVVIPAKNEEGCIGKVIEDLLKEGVGEIIVVDGNSQDKTAEIAKKLGAKVVAQGGVGYGDAFLTGANISKGDIVVCVDGDGSYNPKDIHRLVAQLGKGYDVSFASRYHPGGGSEDDTIIRYLGNKFFTWICNTLFGVRLSDVLFFYFAIKKEHFKNLTFKSNGFELSIEFPIRVHQSNLKYVEIPSLETKRIAGKSKVNAFSDGLIILFFLLKELPSKNNKKCPAS